MRLRCVLVREDYSADGDAWNCKQPGRPLGHVGKELMRRLQTFRTGTRGRGLTGGARMLLPGCRTRTRCLTWALPFGTRRSIYAPWERRVDGILTLSSDFLKERLFGLANSQGNHGEGVREAHFHLDNTPV